ncbi:hypothetical protein KOI35_32440 [Actinoplanes bogorensis]|uniref:Double-GTPase 2 domain-containing protein n=1 Tax=Paractinoplanes bogorensis TaxID=1610840 RepID=A0ABS5YXS4_9ACTN|nr:hypothetical protein [Actinoplanes bogorensis]MBU2668231.1 hypothetical protein [Actinoplanes bogorensis]
MPVVLVVVAAVVAFGLYLWLCGLAFVYVTFPVSLLATGAGVATGVLVALAVTFMLLLGDQDERVRAPADVVAGKLPIVRTPKAIRPDSAWPGYFVVQAWLDWWVAVERVSRVTAGVWAGAAEGGMAAGWFTLALWPVVLPIVVFLLAGTIGAAGAMLLVAVALTVLALAGWVLAVVAVALLRGLDRLARLVRRSSGTCPHCYETSARPVYQCPGAHGDTAMHRDVRPGLLGVFWRRCGCGRRLPTMVVRAARVMTAYCPRCSAPLHDRAGLATDVRVPVFGAPSSGKTHLVMAGVVGLLRGPSPAEVTLADEHSRRTYDNFAQVIDSGGSASKTDAAHQPIAVTLRFRSGRREALLHVYDAAGEAISDAERNTEYFYLDGARTLVFVLDPFAIPAVRQRFRRTFETLFRTANASADLPEPSYQNVATRLRKSGVRTERQQRLAFVVSKLDLVRRLPGLDGLPDDSDAIRAWLLDEQMDNLVQAAERDFREVRYFAVSATDARLGRGPVAPFAWLLADEPIPLPGQRNPGESRADETTKA